MDGLEEKLGAILSSPETMEQIFAIASSLGGGHPPPDEPQAPPPQSSSESGGGLGDLLSGFDPGMLLKLLPLIQEYQAGGGEREALLQALKPFLRQETGEKLEKAIRITRISRVIRTGMGLFKGEGGNGLI